MLQISEIFRSIQGEGLTTGCPTIFVRLQGCSLRCSWCDTGYAQSKHGIDMSIGLVVTKVFDIYGTNDYVCVTGGEPLDQKECIKLLHELNHCGFPIVLETNGAKSIKEVKAISNSIQISMDCKTPSSKMHKKMMHSNYRYLGKKDQIKFIIADKKDYEFAKDVVDTYVRFGNVIFSPAGGLDLKWLVENVLKDRLDVRVMGQMHKQIWGNKKGV